MAVGDFFIAFVLSYSCIVQVPSFMLLDLGIYHAPKLMILMTISCLYFVEKVIVSRV